jgi:hypothetical protein
MVMKQILDILELIEGPETDVSKVFDLFTSLGIDDSEIITREVREDKGKTEFIKILIQGENGKTAGSSAPTLGIVGRLGGMGARPQVTGFVSDADGAIASLAAAAKIAAMRKIGDVLAGDVVCTTHLCPDAPTVPHDPVPFMDSPVSMETMNRLEVTEEMDAILSIDSTKGNRVINHRGFAISPTIKDGYILRVSEDLLDIMQNVTGKLPVVFPVTIQDITPYGNGVFHLNSILQPATATSAPVVGVALTAEVAVPGCATGANQITDLEAAVRFVIEVAKAFGKGQCAFYDEEEYRLLLDLYGSMKRFKEK